MTEFAAAPYLLHGSSGRRFVLQQGQSWAIGRGGGCAVLLDNRSVSRLHALIQRREDGNFSVVDLGSRNGSFVNNRRVSVPRLLSAGDRLVFGDQEFEFHNPLLSAGIPIPPDNSTRNEPTTSLHLNTLATIVVVDIRDYTPLARKLPESLLSQTIGTWFLQVGQIAQRHGSWAQKYIGDAMMGVWVHEDAARLTVELMRALRAVSEIAAATSQLHQDLPLPAPLRVGAGVNTGPAVVGGADFTALGDTVNAAFRLEAATKDLGYSVALGERTAEGLDSPLLEKFTRRKAKLKGYEGLLPVWAISFENLAEIVR